MKFRLNHKYIGIRTTILYGPIIVLILLFIPAQDIIESGFNVGASVLYIIALIVFLLVIAAFNTYKADLWAYDKARWKRKGWEKKLAVIGDWLGESSSVWHP